jgi:sulfite reductase beta subunit-like hemoprotein
MPGQIKTLADIAQTYGNGLLDLTTRQQVQLRQIRIDDVPAVFALLEEAASRRCRPVWITSVM